MKNKTKIFNMKNQILPQRFIDATSKLYNAFHENRLNAMDCTACAVGNMCNNDSGWLSELSSGWNNRNIPLSFQVQTGYSSDELGIIETLFVYGSKHAYDEAHKFCAPDNTTCKETQFKGLCAVIEYLCELDGIPNIMDYTSLFETENEKPKRELQEVFSNL